MAGIIEGGLSVEGRQNIQFTHRKDIWAAKWAKELKNAARTPEEVVKEFIDKRATVIDYSSRKMRWKPKIIDKKGKRKMVVLTGKLGGPSFGVESLKVGFDYMVELTSPDKDNLYQVPYPSFLNNGNFDPKGSLILIFNAKQVNGLRQVIGLRLPP